MRMLVVSLLAVVPSATSAIAAPVPFPEFKVEEIDKTLKVGYGVRLVDLNGDGKLDVVVADAARVVWFDNAGGWKLHTVIDNAAAGVKADNVCLDVADVDRDGKLDIALGADWQPNNTTAGGSLQWLRQGDDIDKPWAVHVIEKSIPTLHRIHFSDLFGEGELKLVVAPLKGRGSTAEKNWSDKSLEFTAYAIPKEPASERWEPTVLDASMHVMHNFSPVKFWGRNFLTASYEGVRLISPRPSGSGWAGELAGAGNQERPNASRGSSEVKAGKLGDRLFIAAIEPFHGHQVVVYEAPDDAAGAANAGDAPAAAGDRPAFTRSVIDEQFKSGHALWCADLDGDGADEIIAGFRDPTERGMGPGVRAYKMAGAAGEQVTWQKHVIDEKGMATEDLACADLNADGKVDIVAVGRATGNVRIYWNQGTPGGQTREEAGPPK
jgi:hypothetical protein